MIGTPVAVITVHAGPDGITLTATGGVELRAASVPGALRHLASTLDGKPVNPAVVGPVLLGDLPDGVVPLAAVISLKALRPDGGVGYYERCSADLTAVEALGMTITLADTLRAGLTRPGT